MKVAFVTTVNHNVGDDFVREGIVYLLERLVGKVEISLIHKHFPLTVRPEFDWVQQYDLVDKLDRLPKIKAIHFSNLLDRLPLRTSTDKVLNADIVIQSGAPVYWLHPTSKCSESEWYDTLIRRRLDSMPVKPPFLNIAAGACQQYESTGEEFLADAEVSEFITRLFLKSTLTTVRDKLSKRILNLLNLDAPLLPCTSIFACDRYQLTAGTPEFVALNYMRGGGHYDFGNVIDADHWKKEFSAFYFHLKKHEPCIFICHNKREIEDARGIDPDARVFFSRDHVEYLRMYARASFGILNRVHGAFALASFGRPAFVVGSDSRARMAEEIGVAHAFVNTVTSDQLMAEYNHSKTKANDFQQEFRQRKKTALETYLDLISDALSHVRRRVRD